MKKGLRPITRTANPEPQDKNSISWIIWAAWADRITF
ncbi:MAG: TIGR03643 family protein, partial [Candidatus Fonsibacter lacus]|nr:TIGR03643 family protein [Candidatus Fonsibacter lacus]